MKYVKINQHVAKIIIKRSPTKGLITLYTFAALLTFASASHFVPEQKIISPLTDKPLNVYAETITPTPTMDIKEERSKKVYSFLASKNSPLAEYAEFIVSEADRNDISWTLVVSIAGKESSFGKNIVKGSHNAWGIMSWDKQGNRSIRMFKSWEEAITFESELLAKNYRENMNRGIQEKYCPVSDNCSPTWTEQVTMFQEAINKQI